MTRCVYISDHDPEKWIRVIVALEPDFSRAVFKPLFINHLNSFLKTVLTSYIYPLSQNIFKVCILMY